MSFNSHNSFKNYGQISYDIISYLIKNNEDIWKMLKYNDVTALSQPNLTQEEKSVLIYKGEPNSEPFRVFRDPFTDDAFTEQVCQLRIFPSTTNPENRIVSVQDIQIQIVVHNKINYLDDYMMRLDYMIEQIMYTLNGADIGSGLGEMFFDKERSRSNNIYRGASIGNNKNFLGALITMSINFSSDEVGVY